MRVMNIRRGYATGFSDRFPSTLCDCRDVSCVHVKIAPSIKGECFPLALPFIDVGSECGDLPMHPKKCRLTTGSQRDKLELRLGLAVHS